MTHQIFTHLDFHCGDNLIHLHLLRALAKQHHDTFFTHFCHACHHENLREVIADLPNILLVPFESPLWQERKSESINVWKNNDELWTRSAHRWSWSDSTLELHKHNARRMGFESPFTVREHLLLDYPALNAFQSLMPFDFLIGDSKPSSGQFKPMADHSVDYLRPLLESLIQKHQCLTTETLKEQGYTLTQIGHLSMRCKHHIMVASGPFWTTLNTTNHHYHEGRKRIVLLDNGEQLSMPGITQCSNISAVMEIAKEEGWI